MSLSIHVDVQSAQSEGDRPVRFWLDVILDESTLSGIYEIETVEDHWYERNAEYFKVLTDVGKRYILRFDPALDRWSLHSGFDGDELLQRPGVEMITVEASTIRAAEQQVAACERCRPDEADWLFASILNEVTGRSGDTEYAMCEPAKCPNCRDEISEKTLVQLQGGIEVEAPAE